MRYKQNICKHNINLSNYFGSYMKVKINTSYYLEFIIIFSVTLCSFLTSVQFEQLELHFLFIL